jgi:DNA polymerase III subunit delta
MAVRSPKELDQSLKKGTIEPVYFLFGPETFLRDEAARAITESALRGTLLREFNNSSFNLLTDDVRSAIAAAEQLPMMSERRVVLVRNFGKLKDKDEEVLQNYIDRPLETSVVILVADDLDKRKKLAKTLLSGVAFEFQALKPNELQTWIKAYLKKQDVEIEPAALQRIIEDVSSNLRMIANELNKLVSAALPSRRITLELVNELISRSREHMNWELTDHILARNRRAALKTLRDLLDDGVEPVMLTGLIAGTARRMALAKELLNQGATPARIFSEIRMPAFKQNAYLGTLSRLNSADLARTIQRVAETDLAIKTSKATPRMQMEMLVCELMG